MDRDEAKLILRNFRPDGADANSPEFAEALELAIADRELGDWLAKERARDAAFAGALAELSLPEDLKADVLGALAAEGGDEPGRDERDDAFSAALSGISPPEGLRDEVLLAMAQSAPQKSGWRWALPLAAAAGIVMALTLTRNDPSLPDPPVVSGAVPVSHVEEVAINTLTSPEFSLELQSSNPQELFKFLRRSDRICPGGCVPKGLRKVPSLGCRTIEVDGKPGAIICFLRGEGDVVHLVVFRAEDVEQADRVGADPEFDHHGDWSVARWSKNGRAFLLLGNAELGGLF